MAKKLDPKKEQQEWLQGILLDMLKDEENKYCADCQAKTPRWAAWNLGVFICIRCAGIHRNLGVHISKVRSVNLDSWTPEQVQSMRVMGNEKARKVYEHDLPDHFRRPTTDHQMEQFIRSKYEQKRYILKDFAYPHIDAKDLPRPNVLGQKKAPTAKFAHNASDHKPAHHSPSSAAPTANRSSGIANLLDLDAPAPASALPTTSAANHNSSSLIDDFDSLAIGGQTTAPPAAVTSAPSNDLDDMFGSFVSAPSSTPSVAAAPIQSAPQSSNQSNGKSAAEKNDLFGLNLGEPTSTAANDGEKKSTADILSLFSTAQPAPPLIAPGGFTAFGLQAAAPSQPQPAQQVSGQMNFANFGAANAGNAMTSSMPSLPASMSFDGFGLAVPAATPAMSQSQSGGMIGLGSMGGLDLSAMGTGVQTSNSNPAQFPNPFGQPSMVPTNFAAQMSLSSTSTIPTSPPAAYKIPNKSNAFADLSIGKVMNMNYMSGGKPKTESGGGSGMAAAQPQPQAIPATTAPSQQMNLDDLLGGF